MPVFSVARAPSASPTACWAERGLRGSAGLLDRLQLPRRGRRWHPPSVRVRASGCQVRLGCGVAAVENHRFRRVRGRAFLGHSSAFGDRLCTCAGRRAPAPAPRPRPTRSGQGRGGLHALPAAQQVPRALAMGRRAGARLTTEGRARRGVPASIKEARRAVSESALAVVCSFSMQAPFEPFVQGGQIRRRGPDSFAASEFKSGVVLVHCCCCSQRSGNAERSSRRTWGP